MTQEKAQRNEDFDDGELVIDASGSVAQKTFDGEGGWFVMGWPDELAHPFDVLTRPIRRLVPAEVPVKGKGDPYLYRITYDNGSVKYGPRRVLGPVVGHALAQNTSRHRLPVKIERAVEPQFTDVTDEFL